jgi:hypothetical protein
MTITQLLEKLSPQVSEAEQSEQSEQSEQLFAAADLLPDNAEIEEDVRADMDHAVGSPEGQVSAGLVNDKGILALLGGEVTSTQFAFPESDPRAQYLSLQGRECNVSWPDSTNMRPWTHLDSHLTIASPESLAKYAKINIAAELTPRGVTHIHKYFTDDSKLAPSDPALRLGLQARVTNKDGTVQAVWCKSTRNSWKTLFRCNIFAEYLQGVPNEAIILRPRRFNVEYHKHPVGATIMYTSPSE